MIRNAPRDVSGAPFPTTYWLTCPDAVKAVARLEAAGGSPDSTSASVRIRRSPSPGAPPIGPTPRTAPRDLLEASGDGGVGGTRHGVKCLHAHYAFHLAGGVDPVGAWVAEQVEPIHPESGRAASPRSIRARTRSGCSWSSRVRDGDDPTELARDMVITRLGQGVDRTGRIDPERSAARSRCSLVLPPSPGACTPERIRVAATSAVRDAENREEFATAVRELDRQRARGDQRRAGGGPVVPRRHARAGSVDRRAPYLVLDIGGGSTEFVVGTEPGRAEHAISTQMGSVRLTERFVRHDPPVARRARAARDRGRRGARSRPRRACRSVTLERLIAVAGTATTIQAIALGLDRYDPEAIHRTLAHAREPPNGCSAISSA